MVFFSFMTELPLSGKAWSFTLDNYAAFFSQGLYPTLLLASLRLGLEVTLWCVVIGYPAAFEWLTSGREFSAEEALARGLVAGVAGIAWATARESSWIGVGPDPSGSVSAT